MEDVRRLPVGEDVEGGLTLDELARRGARRMIAAALEVEVEDYLERFAGESMRTAAGWWSVTAMVASAG